jgi:ribosome-associated protein
MADEPPSKTQLKKQMHALQDLGAELVAMNEDQLTAMALPDNLHDAVLEAKSITKFEARRRQLQYIGKLMRSVDPAPIRMRIDVWKATSREHTAQLHLIERWRERLLADEGALGELLSAYPHANAQRLRTLVQNTQGERDANRPPRSYRTLFQVLKETLEQKGEERGERGEE